MARRAKHRVFGWLLAGTALAIAAAWGLTLLPPRNVNSQTATARRGDERLTLTVSDSFGAKTILLQRVFGENWAPARACGPPDTNTMGDIPTAWASLTPDAQNEWLELDFAVPVIARSVRVYETNAPGALSLVSAGEAFGELTEVWSGTDPAKPNADGIFVAEIPIKSRATISHIRLDLDSPRVRGWNEIDAVGLVDEKGNVQWAIKARASSTYADMYVDNLSRVSNQLDELIGLAPGWVPITWRLPGSPSIATETRRIEARGWPLLAMRGELPQKNATTINPFRLIRPIWSGLAPDAALYATLLFLLHQSTFGMRRFLREGSRARRGCCVQCGYDLRFDLAAGCPECGWRRQPSA
jgi:hypothetical protein